MGFYLCFITAWPSLGGHRTLGHPHRSGGGMVCFRREGTVFLVLQNSSRRPYKNNQ